MGSRIECFYAVPIEKVRVELRRYCGDEKCTGRMGYHDACIVIGEKVKPVPLESEEYPLQIQHDDLRWPKKCVCGYEFKDTDNWQTNEHRIYTGNGIEFVLSEAPVGAMWNASWWPERRYPDGICLTLQTPGGHWMIDGHSSSGGQWTRTGIVPKITATPSILITGKYHGILTDGILVEC
jgi:hypothetical protein